MKETHNIHITNTVDFQEKHITMPMVMLEDSQHPSNTTDKNITNHNIDSNQWNHTISTTKSKQFIHQLGKVKAPNTNTSTGTRVNLAPHQQITTPKRQNQLQGWSILPKNQTPQCIVDTTSSIVSQQPTPITPLNQETQTMEPAAIPDQRLNMQPLHKNE